MSRLKLAGQLASVSLLCMVPTILLALYWHEITLTAALLGILAVTFLHGVVGLLSNIAARQN